MQKMQGGVRAFIFLAVLYGATHTLTSPPPINAHSLLAQASIPGELKQECLKGHEYWVGIGQEGLKIVETKKPPTGIAESSLSPVVVRYSDGKGGYISRACKEGSPVLTSIPLTDKIYSGDYSASARPLSEFLQSAPQTDSGSGSFVPGGAVEKAWYQSTAPTEGVQLSSEFTPTNEPPAIDVDEIDRQIQTNAQQNIQNDPKIRDNAFQIRLCQQQGTCEMGMLESENSLSQEQQLRQEAQSAVRHDYNKAISSAYGPAYVTEGLGDNSVARVSQNDWGVRYYDSETGEAFLGRSGGESAPTILANSGGVPTSGPIGEWEQTMKSTIDSPQKFQAFESEYFGNGSNAVSYQLSEPSVMDEYNTEGVVTARTADGGVKKIPREAYNTVRIQGDILYGADRTWTDIQNVTSGKVTVDPPFAFPSETMIQNSMAPPSRLTPLSTADRAVALDALAQDLSKYTPEYWQNSNTAFLSTYTKDPFAAPVRHSGMADAEAGIMWIDGSLATNNPSVFAVAVHHELAHINEKHLFGSQEKWAETIYGPQYGNAYLGQTGAGAVEWKISSPERPAGFARDYGYFGGIPEDEAAVVEIMYKNYGAVEEAMKTDPILASKVTLAKEGFYNMSNGTMNDAYWRGLQPIDPYFKLTPPIPISTFLANAFGF